MTEKPNLTPKQLADRKYYLKIKDTPNYKAYHKTDKYKAYKKAYQKAYYQRPEVKAYQKAYRKRRRHEIIEDYIKNIVNGGKK